MRTYTDEYLQHWGRVFEERDLYHRYGIRFDAFLIWPAETLAAIDALGDQLEPLLPAQADVMYRVAEADAERLEQDIVPDQARLRDQGYVEPMRHHAYAQSTERNIGRGPR